MIFKKETVSKNQVKITEYNIRGEKKETVKTKHFIFLSPVVAL